MNEQIECGNGCKGRQNNPKVSQSINQSQSQSNLVLDANTVAGTTNTNGFQHSGVAQLAQNDVVVEEVRNLQMQLDAFRPNPSIPPATNQPSRCWTLCNE